MQPEQRQLEAAPRECPSEDALAEFVAGAANDRDREIVERHIDVCARCAATLAMFGGAFEDVSRAPSAMSPSARTAPGAPSR